MPTRPEPVVVDEAALDEMRVEWLRSTGREPDAAELDALVRDSVDEELLVREALAHGLHRTDALVVRRLIQNQRFLDARFLDAKEEAEEDSEEAAREGREPGSDAVLLERALALGLERKDVVVRRRLLERMREILLSGAGAAAQAGISPNARAAEPRVRLTQLAISRDRHGDDASSRARALLARLRSGQDSDRAGQPLEPGDPRLAPLGDPLLLPRDLPLLPLSRVAARFGSDFAQAVAALPTGRWSGPIPSSYGLHVVWVSERTDSPPAAEPLTPAASSRTKAREQASFPSAFENAREPALEEALQILRRDVDVIRYDRPTSP